MIAHPAKERTEYTLGSTSGKVVSIAKTYELKSDETVGDEPSLLMTGQGTFTFNVDAGIPVGLEFKAKVVENSESVTLRVPVQVSCKLLEGAEREKALRFPVVSPTAMNPVSDSDVTEILTELNSADNGRRTRAANRLRDAAPLEPRRAEVARALNTLLTDRDGFVRSATIQAVGVWGDASSVPLLLEHLNDDHYGSRGELFEALARASSPTSASPGPCCPGWPGIPARPARPPGHGVNRRADPPRIRGRERPARVARRGLPGAQGDGHEPKRASITRAGK